MKFKIFHPYRGPYIQNIMAWCCMALGIFLMVITHDDSNYFFFLFLFLSAGVPMLIMALGFFTYEPLNGEIYDYLIFEESEIKVQDKSIPKNIITNLKLFCCSYEGKMDIPFSEYNFRPSLSAGTENNIVIETNQGHKQKVFFQVESKQDLHGLKDYLDRHYFEHYRWDSTICIDD